MVLEEKLDKVSATRRDAGGTALTDPHVPRPAAAPLDQTQYRLFSGTAHPALGVAVAGELHANLAPCTFERFPDGEVNICLSASVRRRDVFIIQPTAAPVDQNLLQILAFADACRRASAQSITAVVPYFGYGRSDRRSGRREPIMARLAAELMQTAGIDHVMTVDLHAAQIEGFFQIPVDCLTAVPTLCAAMRPIVDQETVIVAPDVGALRLATEYSRQLGLPVAVLHKERRSGTETRVTHLVGDVRGRPVLIVDDMISTGGTIARAVDQVLAAGAEPEIRVIATHGLFLPGAWETLNHAAIREVVVSDSVVPQSTAENLRTVSIAPLLAGAIRRVVSDGSLRELSTVAVAPAHPAGRVAARE